RSFSIGFSEAGYDEARHAAAIARHLGCDHTELYVTAEQARNVIPELASIYDEPFADSSQIPTLLVSRMARRDVTVVLSGDGGDEVFAGYNRYTYAHRFATFSAHAPLWLRQWLRWFIQRISPRHWDHLFKLAARLIQIPTQPGDKLYKLADVLDTDHDGFYRRLVSSWTNPDAVALHGQEHTSWPCHDIAKLAVDEDSANADLIRRMQYLDTTSYLPDDILTKLDRASMAVSLEARVPLLDHRVVEFAWRLPTAWKMHQGSSKWLLRRVLGRHVPEAMFNRPKMGFAIPLDEWLRGPLREWADELLKPAACRRFGLVDPVPVSIKWQEHCTGHRNWHYPLWNVLMLHSWAERNH
ncbi:MAG: asparagine synthase-related protein, partial [Pseudomonadota bacterium]